MKDEFKDIDFTSEELEREYIGVTFDHCDFTEIVFGDVLFEDCQLQYASFHGLSLLGTRFISSTPTRIA